MDWLDEFPTMERQELRDMKKAIDLGFRDFSRAYGEGLENFFEPTLQFVHYGRAMWCTFRPRF